MTKSVHSVRSDADRRWLAGILMDPARVPEGTRVEFREQKRTDAQNDKMHAMIRDVWRQVPRADLGGRNLSEQDWKRLFTANVAGELRMALGLDNKSVVLLAEKTREQSVKWISNMIEIIYKFGAENGVVWTEPDKREVR